MDQSVRSAGYGRIFFGLPNWWPQTAQPLPFDQMGAAQNKTAEIAPQVVSASICVASFAPICFHLPWLFGDSISLAANLQSWRRKLCVSDRTDPWLPAIRSRILDLFLVFGFRI